MKSLDKREKRDFRSTKHPSVNIKAVKNMCQKFISNLKISPQKSSTGWEGGG